MLQLRLEQRQTQKIVITPQLRQAIKLLQLSAIELQSYIENEIRENPLLSGEVSSEGDGAAEQAPDTAQTAKGKSDVPAFDARDTAADIEIGDHWEPETPGDRVYEGAPATSGTAAEWLTPGGSQAPPSGDDYDPFATLTAVKSLADHLTEQAQLAFSAAEDRLIARYLIDLVEADGYIRAPLEDAADALSASLDDIERVFAVLQTFDPPGVCARDLAECLTLQLKEKNRFDPFMERLLANLDLIAACDFQRLKRVCGSIWTICAR